MVIERHPTWSVAQLPRLSCVSLKGLVDNAERGSFILSCNICLRPSSDRTVWYQFMFTKLHYITNDTVWSVLAIGQVNSTIFDLKWGWIVRWLQYMTTIRHRVGRRIGVCDSMMKKGIIYHLWNRCRAGGRKLNSIQSSGSALVTSATSKYASWQVALCLRTYCSRPISKRPILYSFPTLFLPLFPFRRPIGYHTSSGRSTLGSFKPRSLTCPRKRFS